MIIKKIIICIALLVISTIGCSGLQIKETGGTADKKYIDETLGKSVFIFKCMDKSFYNYNIQLLKMSLNKSSANKQDENVKASGSAFIVRVGDTQTKKHDKNYEIKKLDSIKYGENTLFYFEIRHLKNYKLIDSVKISLEDSAGMSLVEDIIYMDGQFSDGVYNYGSIIKLKKAMIKENFKDGQLPVVFTAEFLKQKKRYNILPE